MKVYYKSDNIAQQLTDEIYAARADGYEVDVIELEPVEADKLAAELDSIHFYRSRFSERPLTRKHVHGSVYCGVLIKVAGME